MLTKFAYLLMVCVLTMVPLSAQTATLPNIAGAWEHSVVANGITIRLMDGHDNRFAVVVGAPARTGADIAVVTVFYRTTVPAGESGYPVPIDREVSEVDSIAIAPGATEATKDFRIPAERVTGVEVKLVKSISKVRL